MSDDCGGPETLVLREVPVPRPGVGEILIRVGACGINYPDLLMIEDKYQVRPARPFSPGGEVAGIIVALGEGVADRAIGDRVVGFPGVGGMAEFATMPARLSYVLPDHMDLTDGACFVATYGTSFYALKQRGALQAGETLLVLGAGGGVGLAAVQLGNALGANVVAALSSQEKASVALANGAAHCVIYPPKPENGRELATMLREACPGGADVIYDPIGGAYAEPAFRSIAWGGRYLVIGFTAGIPAIPLNLPLLKSAQIVGVFYGAFSERFPHEDAANRAELAELYRIGKIKPVISMRYTLERGAEALADLAARRAIGKIVVEIGESRA